MLPTPVGCGTKPTRVRRQHLGGGTVLRAELVAVFAEWASWLRR